MFQFLIGRLGTESYKQGRRDIWGFQFLIGRLGTEEAAGRQTADFSFNSL